MKANLLILIARLFCRPTKRPGMDLTSLDAVGSVFTIDPILRDFVEYVTMSDAFPEGSLWDPSQVSYRRVARKHLEFHLPVSLREFQSDLVPYAESLPTIANHLHPINANHFDSRGRRRAAFLCGDIIEEVQVMTAGSEWLRSLGYASLRDLFTRTKNDTVAWLELVHSLGIPTKSLSTAEVGLLTDCLGEARWVKAITVRIDTSSWIPRGTQDNK